MTCRSKETITTFRDLTFYQVVIMQLGNRLGGWVGWIPLGLPVVFPVRRPTFEVSLAQGGTEREYGGDVSAGMEAESAGSDACD